MAKEKTAFFCRECGNESAKWLGRCPACGQWNSFVEERKVTASPKQNRRNLAAAQQKPRPIREVEDAGETRFPTGMGEVDRVLGGGIVPGSLILVGGDPGIGKSTLLLQAAHRVADSQGPVLYVSGEESAQQIKLRAKRLGTLSDHLYLLAETDLEAITRAVEELAPTLVIVDSIQTVFLGDLTGAPGSVGQVRECTAHLLRVAKDRGVAVAIVGHVTKDGAIAGPRVLEHMVDTVLYLEGERHYLYRILRGVKNRFGSTNELGVFEMREEGMAEVSNPSAMFLAERTLGVAGSVVVASIEGTRPVLVEIQALVSPSAYGQPRRMATGLDYNRVALLTAVLEKRVGLSLGNQDIYINVAGGLRIDEPAVDLGVALAIASGFRNRPTDHKTVVVGEVGLTGEVRGVGHLDKRLREAAKLGFERCVCPARNGQYLNEGALEVLPVDSVEQALGFALGG